MKHVLKKYFIPHEENNYHPHVLHTKRAVLYSFLFIVMKAILFLVIVLLPMTAFTLPEVLQEQQIKIITLTNNLREKVNEGPLKVNFKLTRSSGLKAEDMVKGQYFSHTNPENHGLAYFLAQAGYSYRTAGENLGMGFMDAEDVVNAWVNSPTHYANIIEPEFVEIGVNLAEGMYDNVPTVYVVQHFGTPKQVVVPAVTSSTLPAPAPTLEKVSVLKPGAETFLSGPDQTQVTSTSSSLSLRATTPAPTFETIFPAHTIPVTYAEKFSYIEWREVGDSEIVVHPVVAIQGNVREVSVVVEGQTMFLNRVASTPEDEFIQYTGEFALTISKQELFDVILPASVKIITQDDEFILETVVWKDPPIISPTPIEKYIKAQKILPFISSITRFIESVYTLFIALFAVALALMIGIQIKKQHPHIIVQTIALIFLLVVLMIA